MYRPDNPCHDTSGQRNGDVFFSVRFLVPFSFIRSLTTNETGVFVRVYPHHTARSVGGFYVPFRLTIKIKGDYVAGLRALTARHVLGVVAPHRIVNTAC